MADSKKYNGSTWEHSLRKLTTDTGTLTTLPADIYVNDTTATVGLKGNMEQASGVSPTTPIMPEGTGDMSSNLYNVSDKSATTNSIVTLVDLGADTTVNTITVSCMFDNILATGAYSAFLDFLKDDNTHQYVTLSNMHNVADDTPVIANTITTGNYYVTKNNITFRYIKAYLYSTAYNKFQSGIIKWAFYDSEKKDYEPYGYKIPISSANTTTPVYLGEVETTRKIKKLVLTGEENWSGSVSFRISLSGQIGTIAPICTHYRGVTTATYGDLVDGRITVNGGVGLTLAINDSVNQTSIADWKSYLAQQYAAGTPVTVWYVLAEPTTGIVNEPLMKIGAYADTVSGITIPTITGKDTVDVDTTLKPSEVSLSYTGWHDATVKEWDGSQWNE